MIFAYRYAGWVGTVAARYTSVSQDDSLSPPSQLEQSKHRLAAVAGTSTCHLVQVSNTLPILLAVLTEFHQSPQGVFVPGVWGPYRVLLFSLFHFHRDLVSGCSIPEVVDE
jgi:ribulose kinase